MTSIPSPNKGESMLDLLAIGPEQENVQTWRKRCGISTESQIRLVKLSHMRYQHTELDTISAFLLDFGMTVAKRTDDEVWFRGYGTDQYVYYAKKGPKAFLGGTFEVESFHDLERATKLAGASAIEELTNAPGGGHMVHVTDPDGFLINLLFGQTPAPAGPFPEKLTYNYEDKKPRVRMFQRFTPGPAAVHKLGHYGLCTTQFESLVQFYTTNFNIVPTDYLYVSEDNRKRNVGLFAHIDRGEENVDHHCFFLNANSSSHVHHCSFEVHDFDTQSLGHHWLAGKGYKSVWGVGRHILGSQIFDYWWDTSGNMVEHYADGDLVNEQTPIGYGLAGDESLAVWGPELPPWFLQ